MLVARPRPRWRSAPKIGAEQIVAAAHIVAAAMAARHGDEHLWPADKSRLKAFALN
jgi:hypothetical protein